MSISCRLLFKLLIVRILQEFDVMQDSDSPSSNSDQSNFFEAAPLEDSIPLPNVSSSQSADLLQRPVSFDIEADQTSVSDSHNRGSCTTDVT